MAWVSSAQLACIGDIVLDRYEDGEVFLGGVALNVAVQAAACGCATSLYAAVGDDSSEDIVTALAGVRHLKPCITVEVGRTPTIPVQLFNGERSFGALQVGVMNQVCGRLSESALREFRFVFVPVLNGLGVVSARVATIVNRERLVLQLSQHSQPDCCWQEAGREFWSLARAAGKRACIVAAGCNIGSEEEMRAVSTEAKGCTYIFTLGESGVFVYTNGMRVFQACPGMGGGRVDTNGCGDALLGAALAELTNGRSLIDSVITGIRAADEIVAKKGANPLGRFTEQSRR